jgi:hypothetical protein
VNLASCKQSVSKPQRSLHSIAPPCLEASTTSIMLPSLTMISPTSIEGFCTQTSSHPSPLSPLEGGATIVSSKQKQKGSTIIVLIPRRNINKLTKHTSCRRGLRQLFQNGRFPGTLYRPLGRDNLNVRRSIIRAKQVQHTLRFLVGSMDSRKRSFLRSTKSRRFCNKLRGAFQGLS